MEVRIALAQMNPVTADLHGNSRRIAEWIKKARKKKADIIVFPELVLTGYCNADRFDNLGFIRENKKLLRRIALDTLGITAIIGFVDFDETKKDDTGRIERYNSAAICQNGSILKVVHKSLLPNYGVFDEKRYFTPDANDVIEIGIQGKKLNIGVLICEDVWDETYRQKPCDRLCNQGAEIIFVINGSPFYAGKWKERFKELKGKARRYNLPFAYLNTVGASDNVKNIIVFDGHSFVMDKEGNMAYILPKFEEKLMVVNFDTERLYNKEARMPSYGEEVFGALVTGIRDYCRKTGFAECVIGISGGIDSSVTACIAKEALGKENVLGVNLPSKFNRESLKGASAQLARNLGISYRIDAIQSLVDEHIKAHEKVYGKIKRRVTIENFQARIRGTNLMGISNDENRILLTTGNKTEIGLGYCTLYGDMDGGIEVIGDVNKMQVYKLANYINRKYKRFIIPRVTLEAPPDAELRKDSEGDPFDYGIVAPLLDDIIINRRTRAEIILMFEKKSLPAEYAKKAYSIGLNKFKRIVDDVFTRLKMSVYKRGQAPPIIIVSKQAFGYDLRETIIDAWHD